MKKNMAIGLLRRDIKGFIEWNKVRTWGEWLCLIILMKCEITKDISSKFPQSMPYNLIWNCNIIKLVQYPI